MLQVLLKESGIDLSAVRQHLMSSTIYSYAVEPDKWLVTI